MAVEFYLNGTRIYPETNTTLVQRIGTFDDGVLPMQFSSIKKPIIPMSELQIVDTSNGSKWNFVVVSDDVEVVKKTYPVLYKHNLVVRSKIYEATKHIVRNSSFTQPPRVLKGEYNFVVGTTINTASSGRDFIPITPNTLYRYINSQSRQAFSCIDIPMTKKSKIKSLVVKVSSETWGYDYQAMASPQHHWVNQHILINLSVERYDNGNLTGSVGAYFNQNEFEVSIPIENNPQLFSNITDKTVFKLRSDTFFANRFNVNCSYNAVSLVNAVMEIETYYYSIYDVADILYKQNCKKYNGFNTYNNDYLNLENNVENEELKSIVAPEITFTGTDYYTALYQLFAYIDAIPVVSEDGGLTYQYLNDYNQVGINIPLTDKKVSLNDEYFTNKVVANYQNGRQQNAVVYPAIKRKARVSTKDVGIPQADDYVLRVPKPIDYIDKVEIETPSITITIKCQYVGESYTFYYKGITLNQVDITNRVVEESVYSSLNDHSNYYDETYQISNTLPYKKGSDFIDLLGDANYQLTRKEIYYRVIACAVLYHFGMSSNDLSDPYNFEIAQNVITDVSQLNIPKQNIYYNIQYHAIFDGRVEQVSTKSKYEGETYVNQENSAISLNRMGNNLQGLVAKLGNEVENVSISVSTYGSRMKVGSLWYNDDGERFIANVVKTTFSTSSDRVIVEAQFSKDFNLISQFTRIDQEKRFYEISDTLTSKGYENITEYLYFSYSSISLQQNAILDSLMLKTLIGKTLLITNDNYTCDYAVFRPYTNDDDSSPAFNYYIYIPMHIYGNGNSICFEMGFEHQLDAGERLTGNGTASQPYYTKTTLYTQEKGFADKVDISIFNCYPISNYSENFPRIDNVYDTTLISISEFNYYKKPNEIFHLNYALAFMSANNDEFFFGNKLIEQNGIDSTATLSKSVKFKYSSGKYSIIDNKVLPNSNEVYYSATLTSYTSTSGKYLRLNITLGTDISANSWALVDENDNILIASNKVLNNQSSLIIYITPRRNRL